MPSIFEQLLPRAGLAAPVLPQRIMGVFWAGMGLACMLAPELTMKLSFKKEMLPAAPAPTEFDDAAPNARGGESQPAVKLLAQCFGAQAVMVGILLGTSTMDRRAYAIWAGAILPFFVFDWHFYKRGYLTNFGALGDAVGNVVFLACSAVGAGWMSFGSSGGKMLTH